MAACQIGHSLPSTLLALSVMGLCPLHWLSPLTGFLSLHWPLMFRFQPCHYLMLILLDFSLVQLGSWAKGCCSVSGWASFSSNFHDRSSCHGWRHGALWCRTLVCPFCWGVSDYNFLKACEDIFTDSSNNEYRLVSSCLLLFSWKLISPHCFQSVSKDYSAYIVY